MMLTQAGYDFLCCYRGRNTVEPPLSDHPNAKTEWSLTGGARFQESNHRGSLPRRGLGTSILWKIMLLDAISSYAMCSSMLTKYHSAHSENRDRRMREVVPYKRLKTMENN